VASAFCRRVARVLTHPVKALGPLALCRAGLMRPVTIPLEGGHLFQGVLPEAVTTSIWRRGVHDAATSQMIRQLVRAGDTIVDVGAHFGYFTLLAARHLGESGRVIAMEPMDQTYAWLRRNVEQLTCDVELYRLAAWDRDDTLQFTDAGIVNSSLASSFPARENMVTRHATAKVMVPARSLDDVLVGRRHTVSGIKVDAESAELRVLTGARRVLQESRPWVIVELGDGNASPADDLPSKRIIALMSELGYAPHLLDGSLLVPTDVMSPVRYLNVAFLPGSGGSSLDVLDHEPHAQVRDREGLAEAQPGPSVGAGGSAGAIRA
jgi:FkbM family methyltransferase